MRIQLTLRPLAPILLRRSYRSTIQGLLYKQLADSDLAYATMLHDQGYQAKETKRARFKFFTFSSIFEQKGRDLPFNQEKKMFEISEKKKYTLFFSSSHHAFFEHTLQSLLKNNFNEGRPLQIDGGLFIIEAMDVLNPPDFQEGYSYRFRCIGGGYVACEGVDSSDTQDEQNPKKKRYLTLEHKSRLEQALSKNLRMKMESFYPHEDHRTAAFSLSLLPSLHLPLAKQSYGYPFRHQGREHSVIGSPCDILLQGPPAWLAMAWATGIGEKNSQGMGMIELCPLR